MKDIVIIFICIHFLNFVQCTHINFITNVKAAEKDMGES